MISLIVLYKVPVMLFKGWKQLIQDLIGRRLMLSKAAISRSPSFPIKRDLIQADSYPAKRPLIKTASMKVQELKAVVVAGFQFDHFEDANLQTTVGGSRQGVAARSQAAVAAMSNLVDMCTAEFAKLCEKARLAVSGGSRSPRAEPEPERPTRLERPPLGFPALSQALRFESRPPPPTPCSDAALALLLDCFSP
ncbi:hypothetical protein B296_00040338 [Ensete ventricosum]|uniref:Uncharacterized protein n=1 Tax=Ensete ventricosum TaxID=4639 RepID=A0A426YCY1_ENSVE|nr:hypothetical protein B296_00040338 [Ensete ventricosum]